MKKHKKNLILSAALVTLGFTDPSVQAAPGEKMFPDIVGTTKNGMLTDEKIVNVHVEVRTTSDDKEDSQFELIVKQGQTLVNHFKQGAGEDWNEGDVREFSSDEDIPLTGQNISVRAALQDGLYGRSNHWNCEIVVTITTDRNRQLVFKRAFAFRTAEAKRRDEQSMGAKKFPQNNEHIEAYLLEKF